MASCPPELSSQLLCSFPPARQPATVQIEGVWYGQLSS